MIPSTIKIMGRKVKVIKVGLGDDAYFDAEDKGSVIATAPTMLNLIQNTRKAIVKDLGLSE